MKNLSTLLMTALLLWSGCSFEPESAHLADEHSNMGGSDKDDVRDTYEQQDSTSPAPDIEPPDPANQTPGDPDGGGQNQDADAHDEPDSGPDDVIQCHGEEIHSLSDPDHCGACDNRCDPDLGSCEGGECLCPTGYHPCGSDNRCESTHNDSRNCGACGVDCAPGEYCKDGQCICRENMIRCGGKCVDPQVNPDHCGACNKSCGSWSYCLAGSCSQACFIYGYACTPYGSTAQACVPTKDSSPLYCAPSTGGHQCGIECRADQTCEDNIGCLDLRPARGSCDDCGPHETCRDDIPGMGGDYCVQANP